MSEDFQKKRGRPPIPPEERVKRAEERREKRKIYKREYDKSTGYISQKKYKASHPEMYHGRFYEPKVRIPIDKKNDLLQLLDATGMTMTQLFVVAVREKFGVELFKNDEKNEE